MLSWAAFSKFDLMCTNIVIGLWEFENYLTSSFAFARPTWFTALLRSNQVLRYTLPHYNIAARLSMIVPFNSARQF